MIQRLDNRKPDELRKITFTSGFTRYAEGSVLVVQGHTKVICTASLDEKVPPHKKGSGEGWVTAEYSMLPRATHTRSARESTKGKVSGRTQEISRLIGRALRSVCDMKKLDERQIIIDCDVIQADGGTRCASINGGYLALAMACEQLVRRKVIPENPIHGAVAAVSTGIVKGIPCLDLNYEEDSTAEVDMNFVITEKGYFVEVQGTAENVPFSFKQLTAMKSLALKGTRKLFEQYQKILKC